MSHGHRRMVQGAYKASTEAWPPSVPHSKKGVGKGRPLQGKEGKKGDGEGRKEGRRRKGLLWAQRGTSEATILPAHTGCSARWVKVGGGEKRGGTRETEQRREAGSERTAAAARPA
ncbi:unnamed protein product [Prorocentrum cordatum]|uniref:Uncharacterized protein n=1 Tax=Prorocentrum cordatum TaxID=2364126 RepID=A0ABN9Q0J6_9DINO|nr:unnamed protein product [Polarella glacialis]